MRKIAVLGYGTVGSGVVKVLTVNGEKIAERVGESVEVKKVLDLRDFYGDPIQDKITHDYEEIIGDEEIEVVVETMGGVNPAYEFVKKALLAGKSVATSNKALVEAKGGELLEIAREKQVHFLFEASVGGGIPIIRPMLTSLTADEIKEITGILNGTTNYMMTKMFYEDADYDEVLKEAQEKGYAEANPEADVEGHDASRKIAILSSLATGRQVSFEDVYCQGITKVTATDMKYAKELKGTIKLLATAKFKHGKLKAMVAPFFIKKDHPLYSVNDVFNAIFVVGNMVGDTMYYGSGAGKLPTASAVVGDVIDALRNPGRNYIRPWSKEKLVPEDRGTLKWRFFIRLQDSVSEKDVLGAFTEARVIKLADVAGEYAVVTPLLSEAEYEDKIVPFKEGILQMIRVEGEL
ncbi:homoserine dehydrogenase [Ohessyouella blattaphilus]|uniref:Homoserine dehydrogenase n=1 Tax=Ohessyouella blattaphilus TaxID=2949333 RepID=A0ABT1EDF1_9FIRM|nr:homoserine dehydrogenase [Ohessyouella blattaphilus]MCP1108708.1 homoserine dehydrogenase [Ohessyouella blattaphilus]MCR8562102.1 homoserine dehydrogenase [Ohessyouella blattaphilus]MDL2249390.1 homoserine dehydrogenase [Lachnospiraceae bacterium OttesenSCG-928-J05]